jgi:hypothetical protein
MLRSRMTRRGLPIACVAIIWILAVPAGALATTQTAHAGNVTATLSFQGSSPPFSNVHLKISRAGQVLYDADVTSNSFSCPCGPLGFGKSVKVLDLESNHEPDVVLTLFGEGAHCCSVDQVYSFDSTAQNYRKAEHNFSNAGATIKRVHGHYVFVSADNAFYYAFASFAASGAPIQIWRFGNGHFVNVTRQHPKLIAKDAKRWWSFYKQDLSQGGNGLIAAWAADEDLLGHLGLVKRKLASELQKGHLHSPQGWPSGHQFVSALQKFLRKHGYRH